MIRKFAMLVVLLCVNALVAAHEFWIETGKFYFNPGEEATLNFRVGDDFIGEPWKGDRNRIVRLAQHTASATTELKESWKGGISDPLKLKLSHEGSHVVIMESTPAFIAMDGETFMGYLEEDGIDEVLYNRRKSGTSGDSATELYSRHAKLLLQAGLVSDDLFGKSYGLPIEIIPEQNPLLLRKNDVVSFRIMFDGKPLFGAKVKVWNRYNNRISVQNIFSQQDGRIETHISNPGAWMVSVVKMVASPDPQAQYRSYWGTLVFGVR